MEREMDITSDLLSFIVCIIIIIVVIIQFEFMQRRKPDDPEMDSLTPTYDDIRERDMHRVWSWNQDKILYAENVFSFTKFTTLESDLLRK